jgi:hypothetical protein
LVRARAPAGVRHDRRIYESNTGLGTSNPAGKLDVAGPVYVNGVAAIGTDAVAKQAYHAP